MVWIQDLSDVQMRKIEEVSKINIGLGDRELADWVPSAHDAKLEDLGAAA